jgi:hypothetical protein
MQVAEPAVNLLRDVQCWAEEVKAVLPGKLSGIAALPRLKERLLQALGGLGFPGTQNTVAALTGGVLLAMSHDGG